MQVLRRVLLGVVVLGALLQLVPYGWWHSNPSPRSHLAIPGARAAELFEAACADCHTNDTDWPVYSYVAPMSWLVRRDVEAGRRAFNLSDLSSSESDIDDAADEVEDGTMPPTQYELAHPDARLSATERAELSAALEQLDETVEATDRDDRPDNGSNDNRSSSNSGPG